MDSRAFPKPGGRKSGRHAVCRKEDLGVGEVRSFLVAGRRIAVARVGMRSYRAFADTCPHEAASLAKGSVESMWVSEEVGTHRASAERRVVVCPWHNFEFDLDSGHAVCEPDRARVSIYPAHLEGGEVVVYA